MSSSGRVFAMNLLGISGSLRAASMNTALLRTLVGLVREPVELTIFDALDLPLYNGDIEDQGDPESVVALKSAVALADGIVFACPEYNGSMTAVVKNQVDWASRGESPIKGKPVGVVGISPGPHGAVRGQNSLKASLLHIGCKVLSSPAVVLPRGRELITDGELTDEAAINRLGLFAAAMISWTEATRDL